MMHFVLKWRGRKTECRDPQWGKSKWQQQLSNKRIGGGGNYSITSIPTRVLSGNDRMGEWSRRERGRENERFNCSWGTRSVVEEDLFGEKQNWKKKAKSSVLAFTQNKEGWRGATTGLK